MKRIEVDTVVFGGGIAGLWVHNQLRAQGYNSILFEKNVLGGTQTLASQGMIHGGQRYTLQGALTSHSESIAAMPGVWGDALRGEAGPDLRTVQLLSDRQFLWSAGGITSSVTAFFASKAMRSKVESLPKERWPEVFKNSDSFNGKIYELDEVVLDIKSLIKGLISSCKETIFKVDDLEYISGGEGLSSVVVSGAGEKVEVVSKKYIFTAATGNEEVAELLSSGKELTQRRPLKQIMVKDLDLPLYAHCITVDPRPRVTISAHPIPGGKFVWYLGGLVAVNGIDQSDDDAIQFAKKELSTLFKWIDWDDKEWAAYPVDRAEPKVTTGFLPDGPQIKELGNTLLCWPTKLTFAPALAEKAISALKGDSRSEGGDFDLGFTEPEIGQYPWEFVEWR